MASCKPLNHFWSHRWLGSAFTTARRGLVLLLLCGLLHIPTHASPAPEYQLKAVFLFNFAQFVEWPSNAFGGQTMIIGVLGQDPFGSYLDDTVRNERVNNRQLIIQRYRSVDEVKNCHVLFISRSEAGRMDQIVSSLKYKKILTVSDTAGDSGHGVMIRFVTEQSKIKLKINVSAAKSSSLTISSKLLRLADIVTS
jgi:hypothetical protein